MHHTRGGLTISKTGTRNQWALATRLSKKVPTRPYMESGPRRVYRQGHHGLWNLQELRRHVPTCTAQPHHQTTSTGAPSGGLPHATSRKRGVPHGWTLFGHLFAARIRVYVQDRRQRKDDNRQPKQNIQHVRTMGNVHVGRRQAL